MKFSDRFFRFPIKIYDGTSLRKVMRREMESDNDDAEIEAPDWVQGSVKLPYWALNDIIYHEAFSIGRSTEEVAKEGFDMVYVMHSDYGNFECLWNLAKFEKKLDEFTEAYEKFYDTKPDKAAAVTE